MPPLRMNRSIRYDSNHTNDNRTNVTINELLIDYEHRYLTTCNSIQVQSVKLLHVVFFSFSIESFYIE